MIPGAWESFANEFGRRLVCCGRRRLLSYAAVSLHSWELFVTTVGSFLSVAFGLHRENSGFFRSLFWLLFGLVGRALFCRHLVLDDANDRHEDGSAYLATGDVAEHGGEIQRTTPSRCVSQPARKQH